MNKSARCDITGKRRGRTTVKFNSSDSAVLYGLLDSPQKTIFPVEFSSFVQARSNGRVALHLASVDLHIFNKQFACTQKVVTMRLGNCGTSSFTVLMVLKNSADTEQLLKQVAAGDRTALNELLKRHRELLSRFIDNRLGQRLRARIDASDVVQEAQMEIARRIDEFLERRPMPFHIWLRKTAYQNLLKLRRQHNAQCRDMAKEVMSRNSSMMLVKHLFHTKAPYDDVIAKEISDRVYEAVFELDELNQEILLLRTLEGLSNEEAAQILDIQPKTASKRYTRALLNLRQCLLEKGLLDSRN